MQKCNELTFFVCKNASFEESWKLTAINGVNIFEKLIIIKKVSHSWYLQNSEKNINSENWGACFVIIIIYK